MALVRDSAGRGDFPLVDFLVAEITVIGIPTILTITPIWITERITTINMGTIQPTPAQPESVSPAVDHGPVVVSINTGNSRPMDSRANSAYINSGYSSTNAAGQQRIVMQDPNEKIGSRANPRTFVPPAVPQPAQTAAKGTQTTPQAQAGVFGNLVLTSWLEDAGKDVIYVQNTKTNDVQKITSEPNSDHFRIVEVHPNADPKLFEVVISNGSQQGPVRFRF